MATSDTGCTIAPYFRLSDENLPKFKEMCQQFVDLTDNETKVQYYGFSFHGNEAHCREGYEDAEGLLAHLDNVGELLGKALEIADLIRLEVHGPAEELEKLREPLADLDVTFYTLEYGFRR